MTDAPLGLPQKLRLTRPGAPGETPLRTPVDCACGLPVPADSGLEIPPTRQVAGQSRPLGN
jgi:hypothetical protein